jgi:hypothetical protein
MKCPYCGEEMQLGCIQCRDGVYWSEKERVIAALNIGGGKSIKLDKFKYMKLHLVCFRKQNIRKIVNILPVIFGC